MDAMHNRVHEINRENHFEQKELCGKIFCGDSRFELRKFPAECVDVVVTSPPYFSQRDYSTDLQIGRESDPKEYLENLLIVFSECKRILKPQGLFWLNLGDKYIDGRLMGMPWRVALALQDEQGWLLRSDVIWHKTNAMPSSVKTRPTQDHEYVFMLSKSKDYYFNADAIREPHVTFTENSKMRGGRNHFGKRNGTPESGKNAGNPNLHTARWDQAFHPKGRNKRTVWEIPLSKFPEAHFAVFPEKLVENCILASCEEGALVLDPFMGSGTTALVATKLGRNYVGVDCSNEYCVMANERVRQCQISLPFG